MNRFGIKGLGNVFRRVDDALKLYLNTLILILVNT